MGRGGAAFSNMPAGCAFSMARFTKRCLHFGFMSAARSGNKSYPFVSEIRVRPLADYTHPGRVGLLSEAIGDVSLRIISAATAGSG